MKAFEIRKKAVSATEGEYVLGLNDTGSHACYMIYGILAPGEGGRAVRPGKGHEEMVLAARGDIEVSGAVSGTLREGTAFHIKGESECLLHNRATREAVYIIAGGHSEGGHH
jgi:hypothetical protein